MVRVTTTAAAISAQVGLAYPPLTAIGNYVFEPKLTQNVCGR